ncbi:MAG TPA: AI-2E family transporter, partial [Aggregicoccus sp.]|nr:AI-2E family transporter [Aggregicoccus sp.]
MSPRTVWVVGLNVLGLVVLVGVLRASRTVISWILISLFLALSAWPAVEALRKRGMKKGLAVALVSVGALGLLAGALLTLVPMLVEQGTALVRAAPELLERSSRHPWVQWANARFGLLERAQAELREAAPGAAGRAFTLATSLVGGVVALITIGILTLFMLLFGEDVVQKGLTWLPPERRTHVAELARRMRRVVGSYTLGTFIIAAAAGVMTSVSLALLGVPYFLALGVAMVLTSLLPYVGSVIGGVLVVGTTFASAGTKAGIICAVIFLVYQQVEGNILQPLVQRRTLSMNPLLTALAMLVGTSLAGFLGTLLAVPVAGALQVLLQDALTRRQLRWQGPPSPAAAPPGVEALRREAARAAQAPAGDGQGAPHR